MEEEKEEDKKEEVDERGVIYSSVRVSSLHGFVSHCMCAEWETGGGSSKEGEKRERERERQRREGGPLRLTVGS